MSVVCNLLRVREMNLKIMAEKNPSWLKKKHPPTVFCVLALCNEVIIKNKKLERDDSNLCQILPNSMFSSMLNVCVCDLFL